MTNSRPSKWIVDNFTRIGVALVLVVLVGGFNMMNDMSEDLAVIKTTQDIQIPRMLTAIEKNHRSVEAHQAHHNNDHFATRAGDE